MHTFAQLFVVSFLVHPCLPCLPFLESQILLVHQLFTHSSKLLSLILNALGQFESVYEGIRMSSLRLQLGRIDLMKGTIRSRCRTLLDTFFHNTIQYLSLLFFWALIRMGFQKDVLFFKREWELATSLNRNAGIFGFQNDIKMKPSRPR